MDNTTEKEFIQKFAIELTNTNVYEREQIGKKYFKLWKNSQDTYDMYKALMESFEISIKERSMYEYALKQIKEEIGDLKDISKLINLEKILNIIDEVLNV